MKRAEPEHRQLLEDRQLAVRVVGGDVGAFESFYEAYLPRLYGFAIRRLDGNEADAEDVVQRTFIKAMRGLDDYRGDATLFTWMCAICRREIHDFVNERGQRERKVEVVEDDIEVRTALEQLADPDEWRPEVLAHRRDIAGLVHATLIHLPPRYGDVLERRYLRGDSIVDIASALGLGRDATDSLLARARRAFRDGFAAVAETADMNLSDLIED